VAGDQHRIGAAPAGHHEPRQVAGRRGGRLALGAELHDAFRRTEAHARHRIDDHAQARPAVQVVAPGGRFAAPHIGHELAVVGPGQRGLDLARPHPRLGRRPLRQQAGMHEAELVLDVAQRLPAQPAEQVVAVRRVEDVGQRVVLAALAETLGDHQQMEVVVAEHGDRRRPEIADKTQGF